MDSDTQHLQIDARLSIISHVPYVNRNGSNWINLVEWLILDIFAKHFRHVTLIRPYFVSDAIPNDWIRVPDRVDVRPCGCTGDRINLLKMMCGIAPSRLEELLGDSDVVYGRLPGYEAYYALRFAHKMGKVTMASLHGDWAESYRAEWCSGIKLYLAPFFEKRTAHIFHWVAKSCDLLFTVGDALRFRYGNDRNDVCVFANYLVRHENLAARVRASHKETMDVLFVGSLSPRKGVAYLIQALHDLRQRGRDVRVTLAGDGSGRSDFESMVRNLGLDSSITFLGYVPMGDKLWHLYENHDMFILPSVAGEGSPKVILEAMAKGCPVIATRIGNIMNMIEDGVNGILVRPRSKEDIVMAVEDLWDDVHKRNRIMKNSLLYARQNTYEMQVDHVGSHLRKKLIPLFGSCVARS